jgi:diguanylate cyclase (GGDEF)-like protein
VGANDYITKPFNNVELQARVQVGKPMLGLQLELNLAKEKLAFQASHDVLTGLPNRRAIMEALDKEISRSYRQQQPLCVAMCDIDFFKHINDNYGHLAGDQVIREVTQRISAELRPYDIAGRYGGEEFLLVFNSSFKDAHKLLERIRLSIANTPFNYEKESLKVTISSGVTVYDSADEEGDRQVLNDAADKALYQAKDGGRNKVVLA